MKKMKVGHQFTGRTAYQFN